MFCIHWNELQEVLEEIAPSEAQAAKARATVSALREKASQLPRKELLHQLCAGIWLTMSDEGPEVIAMLEQLTRMH